MMAESFLAACPSVGLLTPEKRIRFCNKTLRKYQDTEQENLIEVSFLIFTIGSFGLQ